MFFHQEISTYNDQLSDKPLPFLFPSDPTLTPENVDKVMRKVVKDWNALGTYLGVPRSIITMINSDTLYSEVRPRKRQCTLGMVLETIVYYVYPP